MNKKKGMLFAFIGFAVAAACAHRGQPQAQGLSGGPPSPPRARS